MVRTLDEPGERGAGAAADTARPRLVVVGGGFAGFYALRRLRRLLPSGRAELVLIAPSDYLLYSPLQPEVASGTLNPRDVAVSLRQTLRGVRPVFGHATAVDLAARTVTVRRRDGAVSIERWDRLILTPGSVTRRFDIPGLAEHAHGMKTIEEALFLRNHVLAQMDLADSLPDTPAGRAERAERLTVVSVGAGYTGAEFIAQMQHWAQSIARRWDSFRLAETRWVLVDLAQQILPELGSELAREAMQLLTTRGIEIRLGTTVASATATSVTLTDGSTIPTRTLVWSAGVSPSPLVTTLGLPTVKGRLSVDAQLAVPGVTHVWAAGDAAAVPDLTRMHGDDSRSAVAITPPTAQHAQRQGRTVARNVAASLGIGHPRPYRHHDLGLVADLGGAAAVARVLGMTVTGRPAKALARGYHLYALPSVTSRARVATDWALGALLPTQVVQLADVRPEDALIPRAEATDVYPEGLF